MSHGPDHEPHGIWDRFKHFLHDAWHHLWNTLLTINSIVLAFVAFYTIYAAFASIYYLTIRPIEIGIVLSAIFLVIELLIAAIEEVAG